MTGAASSRLHWLDELRGLAALAVMAGHYRVFYDPGNTFAAAEMLPRGVQVFYALSGYIMYYLYGSFFTKPGDWRAFMVKRVFRILPLFYLTVAAAFILGYGKIFLPFWNLLAHLLVLPMGLHPEFNNGIIGVEWSVFCEFVFYLFTPLVFLLFRRFGWLFLGAVVLLSMAQSALAIALGLGVEMRAFLYNLPTAQLCFYVLGMAVAAVDLSPEAGWRRALRLSPAYSNTAVMLMLLLTAMLPYAAKIFSVQLYLFFPLIALLLVAYPGARCGRWVHAGLFWCGERSFSIYLIHYLPLKFLPPGQPELLPWWAAGSLLFTFVASDLAFRFVELPGIQLGRRSLAALGAGAKAG